VKGGYGYQFLPGEMMNQVNHNNGPASVGPDGNRHFAHAQEETPDALIKRGRPTSSQKHQGRQSCGQAGETWSSDRFADTKVLPNVNFVRIDAWRWVNCVRPLP
jgi:hypothetical protein